MFRLLTKPLSASTRLWIRGLLQSQHRLPAETHFFEKIVADYLPTDRVAGMWTWELSACRIKECKDIYLHVFIGCCFEERDIFYRSLDFKISVTKRYVTWFWLMTNLTHSLSMYLFHASTCFEQQVLIIRRIKLCQYIIWYNTVWWVTVQRRTLTHQSVLYQMMYWHKLFLLMMSTCCSKHVEAWNKYIEKECVKLVIKQNYIEMHGQQNIKNK
jgi:hypothetical protein